MVTCPVGCAWHPRLLLCPGLAVICSTAAQRSPHSSRQSSQQHAGLTAMNWRSRLPDSALAHCWATFNSSMARHTGMALSDASAAHLGTTQQQQPQPQPVKQPPSHGVEMLLKKPAIVRATPRRCTRAVVKAIVAMTAAVLAQAPTCCMHFAFILPTSTGHVAASAAHVITHVWLLAATGVQHPTLLHPTQPPSSLPPLLHNPQTTTYTPQAAAHPRVHSVSRRGHWRLLPPQPSPTARGLPHLPPGLLRAPPPRPPTQGRLQGPPSRASSQWRPPPHVQDSHAPAADTPAAGGSRGRRSALHQHQKQQQGRQY